jgi:23S rRNA pseudouridine1911/1915/1917 synthase
MNFVVADTEAGSRLDRFVAQHVGLTRAAASRLIEQGQVRVGPRLGRKGTTLSAGDVVTLEGVVPQARDEDVPPVPQPELPLHVLYEDADVVAVNKPVGLPSHPLRAGERGTAANALVAHYPRCAEASEHAREGGLCHRLDVFTSGVLLAARTREAWRALRAAFQGGQVEKEYLALCAGQPLGEQGHIDLPLRPEPGQRDRVEVVGRERAYDPGVMDAETRFTVERRGGSYALLRVMPRTGRRHQIRAHLGYLGLPILGDPAYGGPMLDPKLVHAISPEHYDDVQGQWLHAAVLRFPSPSGGRLIEVRAPLPPGRQLLLERLLGEGPG